MAYRRAKVVKLERHRRAAPRKTQRRYRGRRPVSNWLAAGVAFGGVVVLLGLKAAWGPFTPAVEPPRAALSASAAEISVQFAMCGRERHTCVVDGDTIWLNGQNLRMQGYDTPEPYYDICGGAAEVALAKRASSRFLELLNSGPFTVETFGLDNTGRRTLATIRIGGRDVGDMLIEERLARRWPDGHEFWC